MHPAYFRIEENHCITGHTWAGVEYQHVYVLLSTLPEITHTHTHTQTVHRKSVFYVYCMVYQVRL